MPTFFPALPIHQNLNNTIGKYTQIQGSMDVTLFFRSLRTIITGNDIFNIVPCWFGRQLLWSKQKKTFSEKFIDFSHEPNAENQCIIWMTERMLLPITFESERLYDTALLKSSDSHYFWFMKSHHAIMDETSSIKLVKSVVNLYNNDRGDSRDVPSPISCVLTEYYHYIASDQYHQDRYYWAAYMAHLKPPAPQQNVVASRLIRHFPDRLFVYFSAGNIDRFIIACQTINYTPSILMLAVPLRLRSREHVLGSWITLLPVKLTATIHQDLRNHYRHRNFPVIPFFLKSESTLTFPQLLVSSEPLGHKNLLLDGFPIKTHRLPNGVTSAPLVVHIQNNDGHPLLHIDYDTARFSPDDIDQFATTFMEKTPREGF